MTMPRVLCLGEVLFDRLSNQPGHPLEAVESWTDYPGGAPANVACALVKLGTSAGFIGCVGDDERGDILVDLLKTTGVDLTGVQRHPTAPSRVVYVVRDTSGDRNFAGFGDQPPESFADAALQADHLPAHLWPGADCMVMGSLELAYNTSRQAVQQALALAAEHQTRIFVDVNRRDMFWPDPTSSRTLIQDLVERADFLKLTDEEAAWLFDTTDPRAIAQSLPKLQGVLVTAGDRGCTYWLGGHQGEQPAFEVTVADTTGAGDGFTAGIIHQLCLHQWCLPQAAARIGDMVTFASAVGALIVTQPGAIAAQPEAADVEEFLRNQCLKPST